MIHLPCGPQWDLHGKQGSFFIDVKGKQMTLRRQLALKEYNKNSSETNDVNIQRSILAVIMVIFKEVHFVDMNCGL